MLKITITGRPGVGKSTLFSLVVDTLRNNGFVVGGIIAPEVREKTGRRVGFKVVDLLSGEEVWLAIRGYESTSRVGSYGVVVKEADELVRKALNEALTRADVVAIDEVGPMELKLPSFKPLLLKVLDSAKPTILVVHFNLGDRDILSRLRDAWRVVLTVENREQYRKTLPELVLKALKQA